MPNHTPFVGIWQNRRGRSSLLRHAGRFGILGEKNRRKLAMFPNLPIFGKLGGIAYVSSPKSMLSQ